MTSDEQTSEMNAKIKACTICADLPLGPKPIFQFSSKAKILIAGQAPGRITHEKGHPFDDPSGDRLRQWLDVSRNDFYDATKFAIVPMGFCYPGTGKGGDLPPRPECAEAWREKILSKLKDVDLTLVIGRYAIDWHLNEPKKSSLTEIVANWQKHLPSSLVLPHPSPRNNIWLKRNPWFEQEVIPILQNRVSKLLK